MVSCKRQQPLERMLASIFFWSTMSRSGDSGMRVCSHLVGESAARAEHCRRASRQKDSGPAVARGVFRVTWHSGISFNFFWISRAAEKSFHKSDQNRGFVLISSALAVLAQSHSSYHGTRARAYAYTTPDAPFILLSSHACIPNPVLSALQFLLPAL